MLKKSVNCTENNKNRKIPSLTLHIFFLTLFLLFAVCGFTYLFIAWATPITWLSITNSELNKQSIQLLQELEQSRYNEANELIIKFMEENSADITITDENGLIQSYKYSVYESIFETDNIISVTHQSDNPTAQTILTETEALKESGTSYPFRFLSDDTVYFLTVSPQFTAVNQTKAALQKVLPALSLLILVTSLIVSFFYSCYITRPIIRLSRISQRMAELDFSLTCHEKRQDEIGILGQNLNSLSLHLSAALSELKKANESLKKDVERERQLKRQQTTFFSAASHELKTPITILKGHLSGMLAGIDIYQNRDKYLARSLAVTNRMEALVKETLTISRMESTEFTLTSSMFCLSEITEHVIQQMQELVELRQHVLSVAVTPDCRVKGDAALLERVVCNLFSNAVLYSPCGSQIRIMLQKQQQVIRLQIENSGVQIPEDALPHLFDAFYRVETSRNRDTGGSGLGLFLVERILKLHGYSCRIFNNKESVTALVDFPF